MESWGEGFLCHLYVSMCNTDTMVYPEAPR
jgi:hypothetical protein